MVENYFNLKKKLEELGYNSNLPLEAVPLVECVLADLLQTTRSLRHYMDLAKDALIQRDKLVVEVEPYKFDNAKLIQENCQLHKDIITLKEQIDKHSKDNTRKIKSLSDEVIKKDCIISKLQHQIRDLSLRGLCAETQSSRNKSRRKDCGDDNIPRNICHEHVTHSVESDILELKENIQALEEINKAYKDEIILIKNQVLHRDSEIIRLNMLLEGGRPLIAIGKDSYNCNSDKKVQKLMIQLHEVESANNLLKEEIDNGLVSQHEAMLRALSLADKNKSLKTELEKVDALALRVEEDCNKKLASMMNEVKFLQTKIEQLVTKNSQLEQQQLTQKQTNESVANVTKLQESVNIVLREKEMLQKEYNDLLELNRNLQDKIISQGNKDWGVNKVSNDVDKSKDNYATKDDLQNFLEVERKRYEKHVASVHEKLTDTINLFDKHLSRCRNKEANLTPGNEYVKDLHNKLCESEQKILMLKKENEDLQSKLCRQQDYSKQNYKDIISQLNVENSELLKENLTLTKQLTNYKNVSSVRSHDHTDFLTKDNDKVRNELQRVQHENRLLNKDKQEYNLRYKESMDLVESLKKELNFKQNQIEQLQEENSSYKMTNRTGKASAEHLRDECNYLRETIKQMQSDVIKEKTLSSQIKNIQIETERTSNEIQNELLSTQKHLSLSKNTIDSLERKCKDLQGEISSLKADKTNLIDNIKKIDKERDHLVLELDQKTEAVCALEQKLKSHAYEMEKLKKEIEDLKVRLNINKVMEHKLEDSDTKVKFLNGEIIRLSKQFDNAVMENKELQNSLADVNGTLKLNKIEYEKSRKEVDGLKQQLQHYVIEIRRIEELLSQKEAERSDMLENFASLSVEANILENTNHSLESESATKSVQLQNYVSKIQDLESKLLGKDNIIDSQAARIAATTCKISTLENEVKLLMEEKTILERNISYLKQMCNSLQSEKSHIVKDIDNTDSELKLYETKIKKITSINAQLEAEKLEVKETLQTTETLLKNARREIIDLKLALQDATSEAKILQETVSRRNRRDTEFKETNSMRTELELPLMLEETIHDISHEQDEDSSRYREIHKKMSKYTHSGTI